ncbi:ATP-binding cassette domain-containing protein [Mycoplasma marinum]|uniref:ABC transporter domain-containing protein n=1 Tax=Mycoplasma marinum TaxID=1937190 RepID=A0A4R0XV03_9MOLU|nr:ATP-binding cassette domain-containing protein [Mycoplasma marinum]TCG10731.1 hypothetical protein C4B24_04055 [Mycoplasma marinum]
MNHKWNIEFENASLVYPNGKEALKNINLKINEGEMVAIIGLSGAGKTTLLKTINKLQDITSGNLFVGDRTNEAIENYKNKKDIYKESKITLQKFATENELTEERVKILLSDLKNEIKNREVAKKKRKKVIDNLKQELILLNEQYSKTIKEFNSKKIAAPYLIQIKEKKQKIQKENTRHLKKNSILNKKIENYEKQVVICEKWQENKEFINKELIERFKKKVEFYKSEYLSAKKSKPYYKVRDLSGIAARQYKSNIGMVFQRYNLIYKASVINNALSGRLGKMPWWRAISGIWSKKDKEIAFKALADVGILEAAYSRAEDLSGGQMQRVALARTISQGARLFLADEPVGALDPIMAKTVMDSFLDINKKTNKTIIMNLHHVDLALMYADRIIGIKEGNVVYDGKSVDVNLGVLKKIYGNKLEGFDAHELNEIMRKRKGIKK